ncbi:MAG: PAS domain S-box protein [Chloroflexota bacterium]
MDTDLVVLAIVLFCSGIAIGYLVLMLRLRMGYVPIFIFHELFDDVPYAVLVQNRQMRYGYVNPAFARRATPRAQQALGKYPKDIFSADQLDPVLEGCQSALAGRVYEEPLTPNRSGDEIVSWRKAIYMPRRNGQGQPVGILVTVLNMDAMYKLTETTHHQSMLLAAVQDAIIAVDTKMCITDWNHGAEVLYGYTADEARGRRLSDLLDTEMTAQQVQESIIALDENGVWRGQDTHSSKSGQRLTVESTVYPLRDATGTRIGMIGINHDITERTQAAERLKEIEERFLQLAANTHEVFFIGSGDGARGYYISPAYEQVWGRSCESFYQNPHSLMAAVHPDDADRVLMSGLQNRVEGTTFEEEYRIIRPDGAIRWIWAHTFFVYDKHREPYRLIGTAQDITERKQIEEALRKSEARSRTLLNALPDLMFELDSEGNYLSYTAPVDMSLYAPPAQFIGHNVREIMPAEVARLSAESMERALATGTLQTFEYQLTADDEVRSYEGRITIIPGEGKLLKIVRDITDRRRAEASLLQLNLDLDRRVKERTAELQTTNAELAAANERLKELDQLKTKFIYDITHELRTPFANLATYLYLLEHDTAEKRSQHLAIFKDEFRRLTKLLESILDLSQLDPGRNHIVASAVDLNSVTEQVVFAHRQRAESNALTLAFEPTPDLPFVYGDPSHLEQVLTNLLTNAINYTPAGLILVSTDLNTATKEICLIVRDTGFGIPPADLPHIFERFYRGENSSQSTIPGTGLGLGIAQEIVTLYGGRIEVESEIDRGSVFTVWLRPYDPDQYGAKAKETLA